MIKRAIAMGFLASAMAGCGHDSDWMIRKPGAESTIGNDPNEAPAGKVIPPRGIGVDLGARLSNAPCILPV